MAKKSAPGKSSKEPTGADAVDAYLAELDHPLKPVIEEVRKIILGANPAIQEGIKWNAPSFHFKDWFATAGLQSKDFVRLILHMGAKVKDNSKGIQIDDPSGLLEWLAKERCMATFHDGKDVRSKKSALAAIVKQWIKQM
jgi:hypothetical protein